MNITCTALGCFLLAAQAEGAELLALSWGPGMNLTERKQQFDGYPPSAGKVIGRIKNGIRITRIMCRVEKPTDGTAVIGIWASAPKMPLDYGFKVSGVDCAANAVHDVDQYLVTITDNIPAEWNIGVIATGAGWEDSKGVGELTIIYETEK